MEAELAPPAATPRRRRIPAAEVRERMLRAAQDIVLETGGVTVSVEEMSLEDVMRRAQVPRSSVYRLWPYKGDFIDDLLCRLAEPAWVGTTQAISQRRALDIAWEMVNDSRPLLTTADGQRAVLREATRRAVAISFQDMAADPAWPVYFALNSTVGGVRDPRTRAKIASTLEAFEKARVDNMVRFIRELCDVLGLRLREGYRFEQLMVATGAMLQGLLLRTLIVRNLDNQAHRPDAQSGWSLEQVVNGPVAGPGLDGGTVDWSLAAVAYLGILDAFLEPVPDAQRPPSD